MKTNEIKITNDKKIKKDNIVFKKRVVAINRVVKVTEGGRKFRFSAIVVVGDGNGIVGYGVGKANEVAEAVVAAENNAKKKLIKIHLINGTIPHDVKAKFDGSYVSLKPASEGVGIKAGCETRIVCEMGGIENIVSKNYKLGSKHNTLKATFCALGQLRDPVSISKIRGVPLEKVFNG